MRVSERGRRERGNLYTAAATDASEEGKGREREREREREKERELKG